MKTRKLIILVFIAMLCLSCGLLDLADDLATLEEPVVEQPQAAPAEEQDEAIAPVEPETAQAMITQDGVTLYYDPQLVLEVEASSVTSNSGAEMYEVAHPAYPQFNLVMDNGAVSVVASDALRAASPESAQQLNELQGMISARYMPGPDECIPEVTLAFFYHHCNHQEIRSGKQFIDFQNGAGVRFVTVYGIQDIQPISNEHLTYVFQGFTEDGAYYVTARFHIRHDQLEDIVLELPEEFYTDETGTAILDYFARQEMFLDQNQADFQPALEHMDQIIASLRIE